MTLILSIIGLIFLVYGICKIYGGSIIKERYVYLPSPFGATYLLDEHMAFLIFTVCTAPLFLSSLSLIRYSIWTLFLAYMIINGKLLTRGHVVVSCYCIFLVWCFISFLHTTAYFSGIMVMIKYILPLLFLTLGYNALTDEESFITFLDKVNKIACILCIFIGGFGAKYLPFIYYSPVGGIFLTYAGFADYLTSIFCIPLILFWLTGKKKYILCALWMALSTILESVRTGMGGMLLVFLFALLLKDKIKAIPGIVAALFIFIAVILFVPEVNQKFYGEEGNNVSATDVAHGKGLTGENVRDSGRSFVWNLILNKYYKPNSIYGSGLGEASRYMKQLSQQKHIAALIHNDYVQIISDTGIIGIIFICLFYLSIIISIGIPTLSDTNHWMVNTTGIMAVSSTAGIAFSMYYDNVVSHSMTSLVMPFIYIGFYMKAKDLYTND